MRATLAALAMVVWLGAAPLAAASEVPGGVRVWVIDPAVSHARFRVRKFWIVHAQGAFPRLAGTLHRIAGPGGAGLARVDAVVDVAALVMVNQHDRAGALGPDFFAAARFPQIRFDSDPFPLAELAAGGVLGGNLTLHGERHAVTWALEPSACPTQPLQCPIRLHGKVSRSAFGMHARRGVIGNKVTLDLQIQLRGGP